MRADCVPEMPSNKRVMELLLPFLIAGKKGLLCSLIENVGLDEYGLLPLPSGGGILEIGINVTLLSHSSWDK